MNEPFNIEDVSCLLQRRRTIFPEHMNGDAIDKELIQIILNNANWAPSHGRVFPWKFTIFAGKGIQKLANFQAELYRSTYKDDKFSEKKYTKYSNRPLSAGAIIAICMTHNPEGKIPEIENIEAVACAVQNMHLTCTSLELGGFWSTGGGTYTKKMNDFLQLSDDERCLGFFYIGHPKIEWPQGQRSPIEERCKWVIND